MMRTRSNERTPFTSSGRCATLHMKQGFRCVLIALALHFATPARGEGLIDVLVQRFARSDFKFMRAASNAPIPLGRRDAIVLGEWMSWTRFDPADSGRDDFEVLSAAVPVGWIRQASADWQLAAFVAPQGHRTHEDGWYWETLGGVFARKVHGDRFAWIVGVYFDVSPLEDFYTPYLGATYIINDQWTVNAVMPWPSIVYAPSPHTMLRFGVTPSGASWSIEPGERRPRMDLSAWNIGFSIERRIFRSLWLGFEIGASCVRGLSVVGNDWELPETRLDGTGFALLTFNVRTSPPWRSQHMD